MKSEIFDFMAMKSAFMGFSRYFHGIFMKKIFIVLTKAKFYLINPSNTLQKPKKLEAYLMLEQEINLVQIPVQRSSVVEQLTCRPKTSIFTGRFQI